MLAQENSAILRHVPQGWKVFLNQGNHRLVVIDPSTGEMYLLFYIEKRAPRCRDHCGLNLKRWHATCFWCTWGKLWRDKKTKYPYVRLEPCTFYFCLFLKNRKHKAIKQRISKRLLTIVEWLAH